MLDSDLLSPDRILAGVRINSKKRLLELISETLAEKNKDLSSREIFESLCAREHLGSTGLGDGVAIPHGRISGSDDVEALTDDHTKLLADIAERFRDQEFLAKIRDAADANEIWQLLSSPHS
jgi:PTS system nitrogen regulatory IIA component